MLQGFRKFFTEDRDYGALEVPLEAAMVAQEQAAIGWDQMVLGRFSHQWQNQQNYHLGSAATPKDNGQTWMTSVVDKIYTEWWSLWISRNEDKHGRDTRSRQQAEHSQALRELNQFYETYTPNAETHDIDWLFATPVETRKQWRTGEIRQWLNSWGQVLEKRYATALETG